MTKNNLVSILLPVYNAGDFLDECLQSILSQTHSNWELIAIDDASTDNSLKILKKYAQADKRIKIISNPVNSGISASLNTAINLANGEYLARMDADDVMYPQRLKMQLKFILKHPSTIVIGGQCQLIDQSGHKIGHKYFPTDHQSIYQLAFNRSPVQHPAILINRQLIPANFSWYKTDKIPAEDLDLYFRLFRFGQFANLKQTILKYRQHANNTTFKKPIATYQMAQKIREIAVTLYGYQPNIISTVENRLVWLAFKFLPYHLIYKLYQLSTNSRQFRIKIKKASVSLTNKTLFLAKVG